MTHGDPLPSRRGARLPAWLWSVPSSFPAECRVRGRGAGRAESWASTTLAAGSRSIAVPGHVDGSVPAMMGGAPPLRALPPKLVSLSGHEKTPGKSSLRGSLPDARTALLKTARVVRCPRVRSSHSLAGPGGREDRVAWRPGWVPGYPRDVRGKLKKLDGVWVFVNYHVSSALPH